MRLRKVLLGVVCLFVAAVALAEESTLTGTLIFDASRKYYSLKDCTPELASAIKGGAFANVDMNGFSSGDKVTLTVDGAKVRPDGKISVSGVIVTKVEKVQ